jgi:hypothetical protein
MVIFPNIYAFVGNYLIYRDSPYENYPTVLKPVLYNNGFICTLYDIYPPVSNDMLKYPLIRPDKLNIFKHLSYPFWKTQ